MEQNDAALGLLGVSVAVAGYFIARGAFGGKSGRLEEDQTHFIEAHMHAIGWREPEPNPMNEIVELAAVLIVGTSVMLTATDWLLKQAGR